MSQAQRSRSSHAKSKRFYEGHPSSAESGATSRSRRLDDPLPATPHAQRARVDKGKGIQRGHAETSGQRPPPHDHASPSSDQSPPADVTRQRKHSHGLSWNSTTRDSVVDNLLSSLDSITNPAADPAGRSPNVVSSSTSSPPYPPLSRLNYRTRAHTHSSSQSSDYNHHAADDSLTQSSSRVSPRGKRSHSGTKSGISPASIAAHSVPAPASYKRTSSDRQRTTRGGTRQQAQGGSTSVMESGLVSAVSAGPMDGPIFDYTWPEGRSQSAQEVQTDSILARGRPVPSAIGTFASQSAKGSGISNARSASDSAIVQRGHTAQSPHRPSNLRNMTHSESGSRSGVSPKIPQEIRDQASDFVRASSMSTLAHSPQMDQGGFSVAGQGRNDYSPSEPRERQGFFKRVFGSTGSRSNLHESSPGRSSSPHARAASPAKSRQASSAGQPHIVNQVKQDGKSNASSTPPPALSKKSSSFFRRRKKSVGEVDTPPPMPTYIPPTTELRATRDASASRESSPIPLARQGTPNSISTNSLMNSSLMNVMSQYINKDENSRPARQVPRSEPTGLSSRARQDSSSVYNDDADDLDIFHSGYTPPPDLTKVKPMSPSLSVGDTDGLTTASSSRYSVSTASRHGSVPFRDDMGRQGSLPFRDSYGRQGSLSFREEFGRPGSQPYGEDNDLPNEGTISKMKIKRNKPQALEPGSFLSDNSDTDDRLRPLSMVSAASSTYGLPDLNVNASYSSIAPISATTPRAARTEKGPLSIRHDLALSDTSEDDIETPLATSRLQLSLSTPSPEFDRHEFLVREGTDERRNSSDRVWLEPSPTQSDDESESFGLSLPMEGSKLSAAASPLDSTTPFVSALSLPYAQVDGEAVSPADQRSNPIDTVEVDDDEPTQQDRDNAKRIYSGEQDFIPQAQAAAFLGEKKAVSTRTLKAYMELYDFDGQNILTAMRGLCDRLILKGESQQVDRILDSFASRWCEGNPNHGFKSPDVVHTLCYSLLLLNTDLHMAEIESKMTRNQFIKNTIPTIKHVATAAAENGEDTIRPHASGARPSLPWQDSAGPNPKAASPVIAQNESNDRKASVDIGRPALSKRMSFMPGMSDNSTLETPFGSGSSNALVNQRGNTDMRIWQLELENVLKSFFNAIRAEPLPLHKSSAPPPPESTSNNNSGSLYPQTLRRTGSVISKAPSETMSMRGRKTDFNSMTSRWTSKNRSRNKMYASSTLASSRTSFDDGGSIWSPAGGSTWSKFSMGKTLGSMSINSMSSHHGQDEYQPGMGFANALSNAIIREETAAVGDDESVMKIANLLEDETLELAGAPWAKEGNLKHRHHNEGPDKKLKDGKWNDHFAVIEKGYLRMFNFKQGTHGSSRVGMRNRIGKGKAASIAPSVVGGGNWMQNADLVASFSLRHSIASILPPPGYGKNKPHVWALSLPTGHIHLFDVGTASIAAEFKDTANYWAARLSKEPLTGGVSNIEYGWSDSIVNSALVASITDPSSPSIGPPSRHGTHSASNSFSMPSIPRGSIASSMRTSIDQASGRPRLPGDRAQLTDWSPPARSEMPSQLMEVDQHKALTDYLRNLEDEINKHQELRSAIGLAYSPRHPNHTKALSNWEKKSAYLMKEIVKFRTYIESLAKARVSKEAHDAEVEERAKWKRERDEKKRLAEEGKNGVETNGVVESMGKDEIKTAVVVQEGLGIEI